MIGWLIFNFTGKEIALTPSPLRGRGLGWGGFDNTFQTQ